MQDQLSMDRIQELRGQSVYDQAGDKIGSVEEIFYDEATNQPEWIGIGTGFLGTKRVLVPVHGAAASGDGVTVPYAKDQVKGSPDIDGDEISEATESELYAYYGIDASERQSPSQLPEGGVAGGDAGYRERDTTDREGSLTRHEEELRVGKSEREAGTARLRKWVETEPVQANVTLERETAHIEREPIDEPVSDARIGEDSIEVPLREQTAMVDKQVTAKERVSLGKDVETREETVTDEVRKERIEVEGVDESTDRADRR